MIDRLTIRSDLQAGLTVAMVSIPQCMAFATIAGLPPATGLYAAVVMGFVGAVISGSPKLNIGPAVTTSTLVFAVLATTAPNEPERWPAIASLLAILVGTFTVVAAFFKAGQFVKFVSRTVLVGLIVGAALLIFGTQLAPFFGIDSAPKATLVVSLWNTAGRLDQLQPRAMLMASGTLAFILLGTRLGPRFPAAFLGLVLGGVAAWALDLPQSDAVPRYLPLAIPSHFDSHWGTDLLVGAAAITLIGIIQTLAIAKAMAARDNTTIDPKRELLALGAANLCGGLFHGFPGAGSFARSALNDMAGARTRLSGLVAPVALALIVLLAAPLARYITKPAIAGVLMATAWTIVDWREFIQIFTAGRHDRIVLGSTILCVFILPIHWAILIGLALSIALFLRRASRLHLLEMVSGSHDQFHEHAIDADTGNSVITMLQVEGPLFFAHSDELAETLRDVLRRGSRVLILRMRRTQQIDFSVITVLDRVLQDYVEAGGTPIVCGLTPELREVLHESALGQTVRPEHLLGTTRKVFGSAHRAIQLAERIVADGGAPAGPLFRTAAARAPTLEE